jgi:hypothetical protein
MISKDLRFASRARSRDVRKFGFDGLWIDLGTQGAVFRAVDRHNKVVATGLHRDSIAEILKTAATRAGINATNIAGHSVRAAMATQAALNGSSERAIAKTTRHRSRRVLRRYIRPGELFGENASASLDL